MPVNFTAIFNSLVKEVSNIAETSLKDYIDQARFDGENILGAMKTNLQKWAVQLSRGEISADEFTFLVLGQRDLLEVVALKQAGLASIRADEFKNSVLNLIVSTVINAIKI